MTEEQIQSFNNWATANEDNVIYVKLFLAAFEDAYLCLSEIEDETRRNKTAYEFVEALNGYIQAKRIEKKQFDDKRLNAIFSRVKKGVDEGLMAFMEQKTKNRAKTEAAREAMQEKRAAEKQEQDTEREAYHKKLFYEPMNEIFKIYRDKLEPREKELKETAELFYQQYLNEDRQNADFPDPNSKSKRQDLINDKYKEKMVSRAATLMEHAVGERILTIGGRIINFAQKASF